MTGNIKGSILGGESRWSVVSMFRCAGQIQLEGKEELLVTKIFPEGCHDELVLLIKTESPLNDHKFLKS